MIATDPGLYRIAQKAYEEHTGARSLVGVCERTFREYKYNLPHSTVKHLELTEKLVDHPDQVLGRNPRDVKASQLNEMVVAFSSIAEEWSKRTGSRYTSNRKPRGLLSQKALDSGDKLEDVFAEFSKTTNTA